MYGVLIMLWMYLTPIFYPIEAVSNSVANLIRLNPSYHYIGMLRTVVFYGHFLETSSVLFTIISALNSFVIGVLIFRKMQRNFVLHL